MGVKDATGEASSSRPVKSHCAWFSLSPIASEPKFALEAYGGNLLAQCT